MPPPAHYTELLVAKDWSKTGLRLINEAAVRDRPAAAVLATIEVVVRRLGRTYGWKRRYSSPLEGRIASRYLMAPNNSGYQIRVSDHCLYIEQSRKFFGTQYIFTGTTLVQYNALGIIQTILSDYGQGGAQFHANPIIVRLEDYTILQVQREPVVVDWADRRDSLNRKTVDNPHYSIYKRR